MPATTQPLPADALSVESAIGTVLQAEQAARAAAQADAAEARGMLDRARARVHAIAERAAQRTTRVHRWADAALADELNRIGAARARLQHDAPAEGGAGGAPASAANLTETVARLAAQLTGDAS